MTEPERKSSPAVVDGRLVRVSASSLQLASACLRKWWFRYVAGLPDKPPSKGIERGKAGHKAIEDYLLRGLEPTDPLVLLGIKRGFVPALREGLRVEQPIRLELPFGVQLTGFVDLIEVLPDRAMTRVTDWKFKASLSSWKTPDEALGDPMHPAGIQMLAYGAWCAREWPGVKTIELRHVTFQTRGAPDIEPTKKWLGWTEVLDRWRSVEARLLPPMAQAAGERDSKSVPRALNDNPCEAYGGCPYLAQCKSVAERMKVCAARAGNQANKGEAPMGILDRLNGSSTTPPPAAAPEATPATAAPKRLTYVDVLPPEANATPPLDTVPSVEPAAAPVPAPAPKRRGRPPGSKNAPLVTEAPQAPVPVPVVKFEKAPEPAPRSQRTRAEGVTLCVGCTPVGPAVDSLAGYIRRLENDYLSALGAASVPLELSEHETLKFGKWRTVLGELARASPPLPGVYYAPNDPSSKEYLVAEALREGADLFVIGR